MKTKSVQPVKESKRFEVEVYVAWYDGSPDPFVNAGMVNGQFRVAPPTGDKVERYVFEVERPNSRTNHTRSN